MEQPLASSLYAIESFNGLNLQKSPDEIGALAAVDLLNVDLNFETVRTRDGYAKFTSSALAARIATLASNPNDVTGGVILAWTTSGTYYGITSAGAVTSSSLPAANATAPMYLPGQPDSLATIDVSGRIMVWNSGWSLVDLTAFVDTADKWSIITRTPVSNRTVLSGGVTKPDRVLFSSPGGTFVASQWVEPGARDGDPMIGAAILRDLTILFKRRKFFVFYGESVDSSGNPVFNYRTVDTGVGLAARFGVASAPEGVYFIAPDGIYITAGDAPRKVSEAIDPMFHGTGTAGTNAISQQYLSNSALAYYRGRLYAAVTTGASTANDRMLVFDPQLNEWVIWDIAANHLAVHRPGTSAFTEDELFFAYAAGTNDIGRHFHTYTQDAGSNIAWNYKTGRYRPAGGTEAVIPETSLVGSGTVTLAMASDLSDAGTFAATSASATLGTAPAVAEGWPSAVDQQGTWFQMTLSGTAAAAVNEVRHHVSFVRKGASNGRA